MLLKHGACPTKGMPLLMRHSLPILPAQFWQELIGNLTRPHSASRFFLQPAAVAGLMTNGHQNTRSTALPVERTLPFIRRFTLAQANSAIPLVSRVVADVVELNAQYQQLRARLRITVNPTERTELHTVSQQLISRLQRLTSELNDIGCQLRDFSRGWVDFVSTHDGRDICLLWQPGQERVSHWHERDGYATNLHPIETLSSPGPDHR